tara:strand:- start:17772 stop:18425 length:654 start_codon:yes stop_codon:yes gene_type:complete
MKLFLDTADVKQIEKRFSSGLIAGVTTNPTLIRKSGRKIEDVYDKIVNIGVPDVSMEVVAHEYHDFIQMGRDLAYKYGSFATIKLPCTPDGLKACNYLTEEDIRVNMTLVFTVPQAILCALAGATYVSPFIGRLKDNSMDGYGLIGEISSLYKANSIETKILAASIRDVYSIEKAFRFGADICTVPLEVYDQMHESWLTDQGISTFNRDHQESLLKK